MSEFFNYEGIVPNFLDSIPFWLNLVLRVLIAGVCGFIIGFERKTRSKEAGIRTHTILAIGAALFMIVSKYSFSDLVRVVYEGGQPTYQYYLGMSVTDASRVVAQAVTGIGFFTVFCHFSSSRSSEVLIDICPSKIPFVFSIFIFATL